MTITATPLPTFPFWSNNQPFHEGELQLQKKFGVINHVAQYAPKFIRPFMPEQHRSFYTAQPFLLVSARDSRGKMWATILADDAASTDFVTSPDPFGLSIDATPVPGDALQGAFQDGDDMGILGIEFENKRRNRVNGKVRRRSFHQEGPIDFEVSQSFGNCPQYIRPREWWKKTDTSASMCPDEGQTTPIQRSSKLTPQQMNQIKASDTLFVASGYRGPGENASYGNDISHRGGPKGWIHVKDSNSILLPDFAGNDMYNTLGNLVMDSRFGVTVPIFESGGMIQMSGRAEIDYDQGHADELFPGALRLVVFTIEEVVTVADGSLPLTWKTNKDEESSRNVEVVHKIRQSADVTSFHLRPVPGDDPELWNFKPGQHLPIVLNLGEGKNVPRTYSLSDEPNRGEYRISVKREPFGQASRFLHDQIQEGDIIEVNKPAGAYFMNESRERDLVLISAGVGVTPVLSMLHKFGSSHKERSAIWVYGARDGDHHPFRGEVKGLVEASPDRITSHVVYSRPRSGDAGMYDSSGRVAPELLSKLVPDLQNADFYMCGPAAFMADMESGLQALGVDSKSINYETF